MCVNFDNTRALNSPIFLSIVKKKLGLLLPVHYPYYDWSYCPDCSCPPKRNKSYRSLIRTVKLLV